MARRRGASVAPPTRVPLARAVALQPSSAAASHALGEALVQLDRAAEAQAPCSRGARHEARAHLDFVLGQALQAVGDRRTWRRRLRAVAALYPAHGVDTARNDEGLTPVELRARAVASAAMGRVFETPAPSPVARACDTKPAAVAAAYDSGGAAAVGPRSARGDEADEVGAREALARAVAAGTPLLLRGRRAVGLHGRRAPRTRRRRRRRQRAGAVSIVSKDDPRMAGPLPANLSGEVREWLAARGVRHALMRPTSQYMRLSTFRKLLRGGLCDGRCYLKQLSVEMSLPSLLRCWDPDPQPTGLPPLGDSYLWWGAGGTQTQLTSTEGQTLAVLAGEKHVDLPPPTAP